jgi:hypothetical protein
MYVQYYRGIRTVLFTPPSKGCIVCSGIIQGLSKKQHMYDGPLVYVLVLFASVHMVDPLHTFDQKV